ERSAFTEFADDGHGSSFYYHHRTGTPMSDLRALRDWLFAKESKRLLLEALLGDPERAWTRTELARRAGLHQKARMDLHLDPLIRSELLRRTPSGAYQVATERDVVSVLRDLLIELGADLPALPD